MNNNPKDIEKNMNKNDHVIDNHKHDLNESIIIEDDKTTSKKKEIWDMIFLICPDQANAIIEAYDKYGPEIMSKSKITIDVTPE